MVPLVVAGTTILAAAILIILWQGYLTKLPLRTIFTPSLAQVGDQILDFNYFKERLRVAAIAAADSGMAEQTLKQQVYDRMVFEAEVEQVSRRFNVQVSQTQLDAEYNYAANARQPVFGGGLPQYYKKYGIDEKFFRQAVVLPEAELAALQMWYNGQENLNTGAYATLKQAESDLVAGTDFGSVAQKLSDDGRTAQLYGDSGFVNTSDLLPEIAAAVQNMKIGDTKQLISREGLHYVTIEGRKAADATHSEQIRIRQIFIQTSGFADWFTSETKNIQVKQLHEL